MDRATVAKYADMDDMTPKPPMDRRRGSKIDPYAALVDGWLEADRMLPRKQRHTAKRVHDRLRAETEYDGECTTTLRYVRRWREANRSGSDGYGELVWAPGVAQIDFGVAKARIVGELVDDHCLVVTFPPFEHAVCDEPARGERGMPVPRAGRGVRTHRRSPASDRHGQRHRRGTQEREGRGDARRGARRVRHQKIAVTQGQPLRQRRGRIDEQAAEEGARVPEPLHHDRAAEA